MKIIKNIHSFSKIKSLDQESVGFVPTMGCLHEGHLGLIKQSLKENRNTVVSIFINPKQFGIGEDFYKYPKTLSEDINMLEKSGVDYLFLPEYEDIYPKDFKTTVSMNTLTDKLCGKSRPTHFQGVCLILIKLCNIVKPNNLYMGKKDMQQLTIIKQLFRDLNIPINIIPCEIIRNPKGLALSSRNRYLTKEEIRNAEQINIILKKQADKIKQYGFNREEIIQDIQSSLSILGKIDYIAITDNTLVEQYDDYNQELIILVAIFIGETRLLDNIEIKRQVGN